MLRNRLGNMHSDPIADMLNRMTTAAVVGKETVEVPFSNVKYGVAKVLERVGFIKSVRIQKRRGRNVIEIQLRYKDSEPMFSSFKRVSKPGQRMYASTKKIKGVRGGFGIGIVSTSKGLMTNTEARKEGIGGELICELW